MKLTIAPPLDKERLESLLAEAQQRVTASEAAVEAAKQLVFETNREHDQFREEAGALAQLLKLYYPEPSPEPSSEDDLPF